MAQAFRFEELDDATKSYLQQARRSRAFNMPGVYAPKNDYLPWAGLIVGLGLIGLALCMTLPPGPFDAPTNTAFLQMAAMLPGVWMVIAAFRVWAAPGTSSNVGHFVYADARRLYDCSGASLTVYDLEGLGQATALHNYSEGRYSNSTITVSLSGRKQKLTVHNEALANGFVIFLNALAWLRSAGGPSLSPMAMGVLARETAQRGEMPETLDGAAVDVESIPDPQKVAETRSSILAYVLILAGAAGGVLVMREMDVKLRDDNLFELVKDSRPPDLRAYLSDPWAGDHRAEVEQRLATFYQPAINQLRQQARAAEIARGPLEIFERLKTAPQPIVSIRVVEEREADRKAGAFDEVRVADREAAVQKRIVDAFTLGFGQDLLAFAAIKDGSAAMMEFRYWFKPDGDRPGQFRIGLSAAFRSGPDEQPAATKTWAAALAGVNAPELQRAADAAVTQMLQDVGGNAVANARGPANVPQIPGGQNMPFPPGFPGAPR